MGVVELTLAIIGGIFCLLLIMAFIGAMMLKNEEKENEKNSVYKISDVGIANNDNSVTNTDVPSVLDFNSIQKKEDVKEQNIDREQNIKLNSSITDNFDPLNKELEITSEIPKQEQNVVVPPVVENNIELPTMEQAQQPVVEETQEPVVENNIELPVVEETQEPVVENNIELPVVEETQEPVVENNIELPVVEETQEPVVENNIELPVVEETQEPVVENNTFIDDVNDYKDEELDRTSLLNINELLKPGVQPHILEQEQKEKEKEVVNAPVETPVVSNSVSSDSVTLPDIDDFDI